MTTRAKKPMQWIVGGWRFSALVVCAFLVRSAPHAPTANAAEAGLDGEAAVGDWPRFLGPNGTAISAETGLADQWPTNGPPLLWDKRLGTGYSAPSVRGDRLVVHHRLGDQEVVEALEAGTGKSLWTYVYPSRYTDPYGYNNGPRCTPILAGDRCYTFGAEGKLLCLEWATGQRVWERDTAKDWRVPEAFFGVGSTPLLENNLLLVMIGGQANAGMVALEAASGKTIWENVGQASWTGKPKLGWPGEPPVIWNPEWQQASYASPVAATIHGRRHLLCFMRQGLVSLNPTNGEVNFSFWFQSRVHESVNAMNPVVLDDLILISAAYYRVGSVLLQVAPDGRSVKELWRHTALEMHWMTPILYRGNLYAFSGRNEPDAWFRCVEMKTGRVLWDRDERWVKSSTKQPPVYGRGSGIFADGKLIVLGEGGLLGLFRANPEKPEELARYQVPQLHYPCWAAPVLARRRLYLRSEDRLVCFHLGSESVAHPARVK